MPVLAAETRSTQAAVFAGEAALDASNPTPITTPFDTILGVALTLKAAVTPADVVSILTYTQVGRRVDVYAWVHTATDPTLVASTATHTFSYVIVGY